MKLARPTPAWRLALVVGLAALLAGANGVAWAASSSDPVVINACCDRQSGQLRIVDPARGVPKTCTAKEVAISWNQTGPAGATGAAGP